MNYTGNYNLKKPEGTDAVNIDDFNNNADILDTEISSLKEQIDNLATKDNSLSTQINSIAANKADLVNGKVPSNQLPSIEVPVQSVNSKTGVVVLTKSDVGLGSVDNTADTNKNVLSATKLTTARTINGVSFNGSANITVTDGTKAPINHASPNNTYGIGTTAYYGHMAIANSLDVVNYQDGLALSANQGYILNQRKLDKGTLLTTLTLTTSGIALNDYFTVGYDAYFMTVEGTMTSVGTASSNSDGNTYLIIGVSYSIYDGTPDIATILNINNNAPSESKSKTVNYRDWLYVSNSSFVGGHISFAQNRVTFSGSLTVKIYGVNFI